MAGSLRRDHSYIHAFRNGDVPEVDVEAMCEEQSIAGLQVRFNALFVDLSLYLVRGQNHDEVRFSCSFSNGSYTQTFCFSLSAGFGALSQTNNNLDSRITQVQSVCMSLRTITDNRNGTSLDWGEVCIVVVENGCCHFVSSK